MEEELWSIEENRSWTLTEVPQGRCTIGLKWVFKVKRDEHDTMIRHKVWLVIKGYAQRQGIDYMKCLLQWCGWKQSGYCWCWWRMKVGRSTTWMSRWHS